MKRGFWVLVVSVLLILALGVLFWPTAGKEVKKLYEPCILDEEDNANLLAALKTNNCELTLQKEFCLAILANDTTICNTIEDEEDREPCFAEINKDESRCNGDWWCIAFVTQNEEVCQQEQIPLSLKEECAAVAKLDPILYMNIEKQKCMDSAYYQISLAEKNGKLCLNIKSELLKQTCLSSPDLK